MIFNVDVSSSFHKQIHDVKVPSDGRKVQRRPPVQAFGRIEAIKGFRGAFYRLTSIYIV